MTKVYCMYCHYLDRKPMIRSYEPLTDLSVLVCLHPNSRSELDTFYKRRVCYESCCMRNNNNDCSDFEVVNNDQP